MEPKFQSSFIPKGPHANTFIPKPPTSSRSGGGGVLSFVATLIFITAVVLAGGVFGYKTYLKYSINRMGADLEQARATLQPEVITELTSLSKRIVAAREIVSKHQVLTPFFRFLETSTPVGVRFSAMNYASTISGLELTMNGQARGYASLALLSDILNRSGNFKEITFSDLRLNDRGEVSFSFKALVDPQAVSYARVVEVLTPSPVTESLPVIENGGSEVVAPITN